MFIFDYDSMLRGRYLKNNASSNTFTVTDMIPAVIMDVS